MSGNGYLPVRRCSYIKIVIIYTLTLVLKNEVYFNNERMIVEVKQNARNDNNFLCRWLENIDIIVRKVFRRRKD